MTVQNLLFQTQYHNNFRLWLDLALVIACAPPIGIITSPRIRKFALSSLVPLYLKSLNLINSLRNLYWSKVLRSVGSYVEIQSGCHFSKVGLIEIGHHVFINVNTKFLTIKDKIKIGNYVLIGPNCSLMSASHGYQDYKKPIYFQKFSSKNGDITIEDDVWIGANATILGGVTIGKGAVIGAGSVVTKSVKEYSVVAGVPAKVIKFRFSPEDIKKAQLLDLEAFNVSQNRSQIEAGFKIN